MGKGVGMTYEEALEALEGGDCARLDWLEEQDGYALISDDNRHWAVSSGKFQSAFTSKGIVTGFWIEAKDWQDSIREAIDAAIKSGEDD